MPDKVIQINAGEGGYINALTDAGRLWRGRITTEGESWREIVLPPNCAPENADAELIDISRQPEHVRAAIHGMLS
jgi:hypothetical protein